jgi:hypothetical protein
MQFPEVDLCVFSLCLSGHLPVGGRMLWKSCDSEDMGWGSSDLLESKHIPRCSSWRWFSLLSNPLQEFTSVWESKLRISHDLEGLGLGPSIPPNSQRPQPGSRPNTMPATQLMLCFSCNPQALGRAFCQWGLYPSLLLELPALEPLCGTMLHPLFVHDHFLGPSSTPAL